MRGANGCLVRRVLGPMGLKVGLLEPSGNIPPAEAEAFYYGSGAKPNP